LRSPRVRRTPRLFAHFGGFVASDVTTREIEAFRRSLSASSRESSAGAKKSLNRSSGFCGRKAFRFWGDGMSSLGFVVPIGATSVVHTVAHSGHSRSVSSRDE
jgi:hypothetical protein